MLGEFAGEGRREVGLGCGPCGAEKRAGAREGVGRCGLGWVFFPILFLSSFLFLIQTNLTQMNPNLNLNSLKHSNKLNKNVHQHECNNKVSTLDKILIT